MWTINFKFMILIPRVITGDTARSTTRRYLIYSEADFEVFRPAGDMLHQWR